MSDLRLSIPMQLRRGLMKRNEKKSIETAVILINLMCRELGLTDLGEVSLLDMGCGTKFTQAILEYDLPLKQYTGIDVYKEMVEFLNSSVDDARFSFHHMNIHNEMYNPAGEYLTDTTELAVPPESFDVVSLFSVFTHLAPHDYVNMLKVLRRYIKPSGKLIFSLFVNERSTTGLGLMDGMYSELEAQGGDLSSLDDPPDFYDAHKDESLRWAVYSREFALKLIEGTGWAVESLNPPQERIQHYFICRPA